MNLEEAIKRAVELFLEEIEKDKFIEIVSHFDTDGVTAAAIMTQTLKRLDKKFRINIVKQLDNEYIDELKKRNIDMLMFLDLGSAFIDSLKDIQCPIFILDHHEMHSIAESDMPSQIVLVNSSNFDEELSGAGVSYLFAKSINEKNKDLAKLAVLGMVGDMIDQDINRFNNIILKDAEITIRKGPLIFSATRSLHKALEFSSNVFIPQVTGSSKGVSDLLREAEIKIKDNERYRTLLDLSQEEMSRLVTAIILRRLKTDENPESIIGNIYILKFFNHQEDARELSAVINSCGRLGHTDLAVAFCLECKKAKESVEEVYNNYKHMIVTALNWINSNTKVSKIEGDGYLILNAKKIIDDSIIGTISSIISSSFMYPEGTIIVGLAQRSDKKIKCSMRLCGKKGELNVYEFLGRVCEPLGIDYGGHPNAGGCLFTEDKEHDFIEAIEKELNIRRISVKI